MIGHSLGEYTALVVAGVIELRECLRLLGERGRLMAEVSGGRDFGTLIVKFREDKFGKIVERLKELGLEVACYNSPTNIVVSGDITNLTQLKNYMKT